MPTNSNSSMAAIVSSSSILTAVTASGQHEFKVEGYSRHKWLANGDGIYSGKFRVGGQSWSIVYLPGGFGKENADWICFGLHQRPPAKGDGEVKAEFTISLLDKDDQPLLLYTAGPVQCNFSNKAYSWSFNRFIKREDLDSLYHKDDCFCIRCDVTVVLDTCQESVVSAPEQYLHLGDVLDREIGGDITFDVGSKTFAAHKNVLAARSPVFKAEFFGGPMKENGATRVRIDDIEPWVFEATLLHFIYTESMPEIDGCWDNMVMAQHLLVAADRYALERLKSTCERVLRMCVNKSIAVTTLVLAEQHGCNQLKEECIKILKSSDSYKEALVGYNIEEDFEYLASNFPSFLKELHDDGPCDLFNNIELKQQIK